MGTHGRARPPHPTARAAEAHPARRRGGRPNPAAARHPPATEVGGVDARDGGPCRRSGAPAGARPPQRSRWVPRRVPHEGPASGSMRRPRVAPAPPPLVGAAAPRRPPTCMRRHGVAPGGAPRATALPRRPVAGGGGARAAPRARPWRDACAYKRRPRRASGGGPGAAPHGQRRSPSAAVVLPAARFVRDAVASTSARWGARRAPWRRSSSSPPPLGGCHPGPPGRWSAPQRSRRRLPSPSWRRLVAAADAAAAAAAASLRGLPPPAKRPGPPPPTPHCQPTGGGASAAPSGCRSPP